MHYKTNPVFFQCTEILIIIKLKQDRQNTALSQAWAVCRRENTNDFSKSMGFSSRPLQFRHALRVSDMRLRFEKKWVLSARHRIKQILQQE